MSGSRAVPSTIPDAIPNSNRNPFLILNSNRCLIPIAMPHPSLTLTLTLTLALTLALTLIPIAMPNPSYTITEPLMLLPYSDLTNENAPPIGP